MVSPPETGWSTPAIFGASTGPLGTARGQYHLRQVLGCLECHVIHRPEVFIAGVDKKLKPDGTLDDAVGLEKIRDLLARLAHFAQKLRA